MKDAFERPFRNNATGSLSSRRSDSHNAPELRKTAIGKEKEIDPATFPGEKRSSTQISDVGFELDDPTPETGPLPESSGPIIRVQSPVWNIELDFTASDEE